MLVLSRVNADLELVLWTQRGQESDLEPDAQSGYMIQVLAVVGMVLELLSKVLG
jgi:hypothetical protein